MRISGMHNPEEKNLRLDLPELSESERTEPINKLMLAIEQLIGRNRELEQEVLRLKDELARAQGRPEGPKIRPSRINREEREAGKVVGGKRAGSKKRRKTSKLRIHKIEKCPVKNVPAGARFKGYVSWTVQDVSIELKNTRYFRERWRTADGEILVGSLPEGVSGNSHFGPNLTSYIIYLSAQLRVTQPLILEHVRKLGVGFSAGQSIWKKFNSSAL